MRMECKFKHDHPPASVTVAEDNPTEPWGIRPVHCTDCRFTRRADSAMKIGKLTGIQMRFAH